MTEDTIFDMASLTKVLVTTTAILQLYEQGKLDLDTPVAKVPPRLRHLPTQATRSCLDGFCHPASANLLLFRVPRFSRTLLGPGGIWGIERSPYCHASHHPSLEIPNHHPPAPHPLLRPPRRRLLKDDWGLASPDKPEGIRRALALAIPYGPPGQTFKYSDINFITPRRTRRKTFQPAPRGGLRGSKHLQSARNERYPLFRSTRHWGGDTPVVHPSPPRGLPPTTTADLTLVRKICSKLSWYVRSTSDILAT